MRIYYIFMIWNNKNAIYITINVNLTKLYKKCYLNKFY